MKKPTMAKRLLALMVLIPACGQGPASSGADQDPGVFNGVGAVAPNFVLAQFSGDPIELSKVVAENRVVLVNFWATWCGPCRVELPMLDRVYRKYRHDNFALLAISVDSRRDAAERYLAEVDYAFPVLYDATQSVQDRYGVVSLPTSILIGADGKVIQVFRGYSPILEYQLESLLEKQSAGL